MKTDEDLGVNANNRINYGLQSSRFGSYCIKRNILPSGSRAFQKLLYDVYNEDDSNTIIVDSNSKNFRSR